MMSTPGHSDRGALRSHPAMSRAVYTAVIAAACASTGSSMQKSKSPRKANSSCASNFAGTHPLNPSEPLMMSRYSSLEKSPSSGGIFPFSSLWYRESLTTYPPS